MVGNLWNSTIYGSARCLLSLDGSVATGLREGGGCSGIALRAQFRQIG